jgi:hypothetical protein
MSKEARTKLIKSLTAKLALLANELKKWSGKLDNDYASVAGRYG